MGEHSHYGGVTEGKKRETHILGKSWGNFFFLLIWKALIFFALLLHGFLSKEDDLD
jgi:hypothetical protein